MNYDLLYPKLRKDNVECARKCIMEAYEKLKNIFSNSKTLSYYKRQLEDLKHLNDLSRRR